MKGLTVESRFCDNCTANYLPIYSQLSTQAGLAYLQKQTPEDGEEEEKDEEEKFEFQDLSNRHAMPGSQSPLR